MGNTCPVCNGPIRETDPACPACGFKLQGSTQQFEPIVLDDQSTGAIHTAKGALTATLSIVRGPHVGTTYTLDDKMQTIGRDPKCDILLNDMTVSRSHARITPSAQGYTITDEQSYNGIWINNQSVDTAALHNGDIIQIGTFCLLFEG